MANDIAIEQRPAQAYLGTRTVMPMDQFDRQIPAMTEQVAEWLAAHGLRSAGNPFLRYHTIDMPHHMDVELGVPVDCAPEAKGALRNAVLPAGRYAVLKYRGVRNAVPANKRLLEWIADQGEHVASRKTADGEAFEARYETYLTEAGNEPDQDQWEIEVAMKLRA